MLESLILYGGLALAAAGSVSLTGGRKKRGRAVIVSAGGLMLAAVALTLPARRFRIARPATHLDRFLPEWQFHESHGIGVEASPERVFEAIRSVRAGEVAFFRTLTAIRRGGRSSGESILDPAANRPLIDAALRGGFTLLADDAPRELVVGMVVAGPPEARAIRECEQFLQALPPGSSIAAMNFRVVPDGSGRCVVTTETRVYSNSPAAARSFAMYWRTIYPGSALIRRMWLRAIRERAESAR